MYYSKLTAVRLTVIGHNDGNMALSVDRLVTQTDILQMHLEQNIRYV
jgi:hypothetical protein